MAKPFTESELISIARSACGDRNWKLGECAQEWTERYAKGRTDADFAKLMGEEFQLTSAHVGTCRRVWEQFGEIRGQFPRLTWSHFRAARAIHYKKIDEALEWANEMDATVSQMLAWVRGTFGADAVEEEKPESESFQSSVVSDQSEEAANAGNSGHPPPAICQEPSATSHPPSDSIHIEPGPEGERPRKAESGPTASEINQAVKALQRASEVVRQHWPRFNQKQRDATYSAVAIIEQHSRD